MKRSRNGNALVLTTVILLAVSIIAASLTTYFYHAAIMNQNSNLYVQKHIELENEFQKTYEIMIKNERIDESDDSTPNLSTKARALNETKPIFNFVFNNHDNKFEFVSVNDGIVTFRHIIESNKTMKSGRVREYSLIKTLTVETIGIYNVFTILGEEYHVSTI